MFKPKLSDSKWFFVATPQLAYPLFICSPFRSDFIFEKWNFMKVPIQLKEFTSGEENSRKSLKKIIFIRQFEGTSQCQDTRASRGCTSLATAVERIVHPNNGDVP